MDKTLIANPKSVKEFGHTFKTHGAGDKNTRKLKGRAARTGQSQGQWLDNQATADFLKQKYDDIAKPEVVKIPRGLGQLIKPDGTIVPATKARSVPKPGYGFRTAYPVE
ncbi:MAG: hypothetical protein DRI57_06225 [Deltaproteobacteria bacterium]|nr:MAG: hypothetical protein DRI57_06225 [Deltaproteobacteria bacterium]